MAGGWSPDTPAHIESDLLARFSHFALAQPSSRTHAFSSTTKQESPRADRPRKSTAFSASRPCLLRLSSCRTHKVVDERKTLFVRAHSCIYTRPHQAWRR